MRRSRRYEEWHASVPVKGSNVIASVANYLLYFCSTIAMLLIAGFIYVRFTPSDEIALIRSGNIAAAVALGGAMLGYACVVYSATAHGSTLLETALWSAISLAVQSSCCASSSATTGKRKSKKAI